MDQIYVFIIRNDVWIYILSILGLVWYLSELWRARGLLRRAVFGLERERGQRLQSRALILVVLFTGIIAIVTYVNLQVAPTLPAELLKPPTPTPDIFTTPLSSPTPQNPAGLAPSPALAPTVTLVEQPEILLTPEETPPASEANLPNATNTISIVVGDCASNAQITSPPVGALTNGELTIFGTADSEDFGGYDIKAFGPQTGETWLSILAEEDQRVVIDGILASVNISNWLPGTYFIQLQLFDSAGEQIEQCTTEIVLG